MLSMMPASSRGGMISRSASSTWSARIAVSSMRVPLGARRCSLNWPPSTAGKKSSPTQRARNSDATQRAEEQRGEERRGCRRTARAARDSRRAAARSRGRSRAATSTSGLRDGAPAPCASCALQQVLRHRRHQRARQDVGREHREDDRFGHRHEQVARHAGEEEHRHEDDADADRRDERRDRDLIARLRESPAPDPCPAPGAS